MNQVMLSGSVSDPNNVKIIKETEIFDPETEKWSIGPTFGPERVWHSIIPTADDEA